MKKIITLISVILLIGSFAAVSFAGDFHMFLGGQAGAPATMGVHVGADYAPKGGFGVEAFALSGFLPLPLLTLTSSVSRFGVVYTFSPADWFDLRLSAGYENVTFEGEFWWGGQENKDQMTGGYFRIAPLFKAWFLNIHPSYTANIVQGEVGSEFGLTAGIQI
ncbi:MAG: hypothetical protein NT030_03720 [Candidatus Saganbacteria bacterium]|nr:hypothetical protein [Candidatus Saganbacteria bacterium]